MNSRYSGLAALLLVMAAATLALGDTLISKPPDQGPYWNPVGNEPTYVYADGFYAPAGPDNMVFELGTWLVPSGGAPYAIVRFEIWGTAGGGPDCGNVIAATDPMTASAPTLTLYTLPVTSGGGPLVAGSLYWFVITGVGMGDPGNSQYQVGAHTQNSVYQDNCTFWYSNEPAGCVFDGQYLTPEMAFEVMLVGPTAAEGTTWSAVKSLY